MIRSAMIGSSPAFRAVLQDLETVAPTDCAVLIQGETGTGKEVIAHAIHSASPRRQSRFVVLNCATIPSALLESELFGHERGAFTGAGGPRTNRLQAADRGTLFLDEIANCRSDSSRNFCAPSSSRSSNGLGALRPSASTSA